MTNQDDIRVIHKEPFCPKLADGLEFAYSVKWHSHSSIVCCLRSIITASRSRLSLLFFIKKSQNAQTLSPSSAQLVFDIDIFDTNAPCFIHSS